NVTAGSVLATAKVLGASDRVRITDWNSAPKLEALRPGQTDRGLRRSRNSAPGRVLLVFELECGEGNDSTDEDRSLQARLESLARLRARPAVQPDEVPDVALVL